MFIKYLSEQPMNSGHPSIPPSFLPSSLSFPVSHYQPCVSSIKYIYTVIDPQSIKQFPICQNRGSCAGLQLTIFKHNHTPRCS